MIRDLQLRGGKLLDLSLLSKYRTELMGFAILIIVLYHFCNRGGTSLIDKTARFLFSQGYVGVDIFLVVSGLGLTYSMLKDDNIKLYYHKRWVRIFPFFTFITLVECWIIRGEPFGLALLRSTTLGYWFGFPYIDWYIPALVGLYVIYPLFYFTVVKPRRYRSALIIGILFFIAGVVVAEYDIGDWKHQVFVYRIPDFVMGCMVAVTIKDGYKENKWTIRYILTSFIIGAFVFILEIGAPHSIWFTNLCFTPLYLVILCRLFNYFNSYNHIKIMLIPFGFMGLFTLELYRISSSFERLLIDEKCPDHHFIFVLIYLLLSIVFSYIAYWVFKRINKTIYKGIKKFINDNG